MRLTELFDRTGAPFAYYPGLVTQFGISVNACVFLCYIGWKTIPDSDRWRRFNTGQIQQETGLSPKEQATARKQLVDGGLIEEFYARLDHCLKIRIKQDKEDGAFAESANGHLPEGEGHLPKGRMAIRPNGISSNSKEVLKEIEQTPESAFLGLCADTSAIYAHYPRKVGKPKALLAIAKALKATSYASLLKATKEYGEVWRGATDEELRFCPHPATWFNQERFNDDPATWRSKTLEKPDRQYAFDRPVGSGPI